jgi:phenylacetic acid degradation operon negative regulatory protein
MTDLQARCDALIRSFRQKPDASARTVLVTVFGDGIEPHGGEVWAGSLLRLVEPLGMNERLVRTSLNRLVGEGVLVTR